MRILLALLLGLTVVGCETVPITGRSQFVIIPEGTEVQMGLDSYKQILDKWGVADGAITSSAVALNNNDSGATCVPTY